MKNSITGLVLILGGSGSMAGLGSDTIVKAGANEQGSTSRKWCGVPSDAVTAMLFPANPLGTMRLMGRYSAVPLYLSLQVFW